MFLKVEVVSGRRAARVSARMKQRIGETGHRRRRDERDQVRHCRRKGRDDEGRAMADAGVAIVVSGRGLLDRLAVVIEEDLLFFATGADRGLDQPARRRPGEVVERGDGDMEEDRQKRDHPGSSLTNRLKDSAAHVRLIPHARR